MQAQANWHRFVLGGVIAALAFAGVASNPAHASPSAAKASAVTNQAAASTKMACGDPRAPKAIPLPDPSRAQIKADMVKHIGAARAAKVGDNFVARGGVGTPHNGRCWGVVTGNNPYWGGDVADQTGSSPLAYGMEADYQARPLVALAL